MDAGGSGGAWRSVGLAFSAGVATGCLCFAAYSRWRGGGSRGADQTGSGGGASAAAVSSATVSTVGLGNLESTPPASAADAGVVFLEGDFPPVERTRKEMVETNTRWLRFGRVFFKSAKDGVEHAWEMVERTTRTGDVDGVDVVAVVRYKAKPPMLLLVLNYRPPVDAVCAEFPAGLVDAGETAEAAALRELKEETGYTGVCHGVSDIGFVDPYKSTENYRTAWVAVDGDADVNLSPTPERDAEENIRVCLIPVDDVLRSVKALHHGKDMVIEAKLLAFAQGQAFERRVLTR